MPDAPNPRELVHWRGSSVMVDRRTEAALFEVEKKLGYHLSLIKGHTDHSDPNSAATHNGTGVFDLSASDANHKMTAFKQVGFAPYHRLPADGFVEHLHVILRGEGRGLDPSAQAQVDDWMMKPPRNGLVNNGLDRDPWRPKPLPEPFNYVNWWNQGQTKLKLKGVNARIKSLRERLAAARTQRAMLRAKLKTLEGR